MVGNIEKALLLLLSLKKSFHELFIVYVIAVYFFIKYIFTKEDPLLTFIIVLEKYTFIITRIVPAFKRNLYL